MKRCAITGSTGYLGGRVVKHFRAHHCQVIEMSRGLPLTDSTAPYSLGDPINPNALLGVDVLIHCAYDFSIKPEADARHLNMHGTLRLFRAAEEAGVPVVVFISTMAAYEGCKSLYGTTKLAVECEAIRSGAHVVRPGTIYGKNAGGLIGSVRNALSKLPIVPLIGSGEYPIYTVHEDDLCDLLFDLSTNRNWPVENKPISAAARNPITFRRLVAELAVIQGRRPRLIPVPWRLIYLALRLGECLGLRLGLRSDSVTSLVHSNPAPDFWIEGKPGARFRQFSANDL